MALVCEPTGLKLCVSLPPSLLFLPKCLSMSRDVHCCFLLTLLCIKFSAVRRRSSRTIVFLSGRYVAEKFLLNCCVVSILGTFAESFERVDDPPFWFLQPLAAKIVSKLGNDWKLVIDMAGFTNLVKEDNSGRSNIFGALNRKIEALAAEFEKMDGDLAEAFKDGCKGKKIVITVGGDSKDFDAGRYNVTIDDNITITCATDRWDYDYPYSNEYSVSAYGLKHF